jgi:thiamine-phosphate pyrophosphorylase
MNRSVYLVTNRAQTRGRPLVAVVEAALGGGVRWVQLREPDLPGRDLLALARELRALTARFGARLLVNDRIDVALASDADGVHLPANSFTVADARALVGPGRLIGVSTHRPDEVRVAAAAGADFAVFGPVYDTPSKAAYRAPQGLAALADAARAAAIPLLAIGGVTAARVPELRAHGAAGVAVIRAILAADDPAAAARALVTAAVHDPVPDGSSPILPPHPLPEGEETPSPNRSGSG